MISRKIALALITYVHMYVLKFTKFLNIYLAILHYMISRKKFQSISSCMKILTSINRISILFAQCFEYIVLLIHSFLPIFQTPIAAQTSIHWSGIERVFPNPSNPWMSTWWSSFKIPRSELKSTICSDESIFVSNAKGLGITKLFWSI